MANDEVTFWKRCAVCFAWKPCTDFDVIKQRPPSKGTGCWYQRHRPVDFDVAKRGAPGLFDGRVKVCRICRVEVGHPRSAGGYTPKTSLDDVRGQYLARILQADGMIDARLAEFKSDAPEGVFAASIPDKELWDRYIHSFWWAEKKRQLFAERGKKCERCASTKHIQVHHTSYRRLGNEAPEDLIILCKDCHRREHGRSCGDAAHTSMKRSRQWGYREGVELQPQRTISVEEWTAERQSA